MAIAYIGLGGNLDKPKQQLNQAKIALSKIILSN